MELTREQVREIVQSLQLYGEIPMKFAYLGEGARAWERISQERLEDPFFTGAEIEGVKRALASKYLLSPPEKINLVDLGCGTGEPALRIAKFLTEKEIEVRYIPVDLSKELLEMATSLFEKNGFEVSPVHMDFDAYSLKPELKGLLNNDPSVFLFLGNTLGNHSNEFHILTNIRQVMRRNDVLLIGLYVYNPFLITKELEHYKTDEYSKNLLYNIPRNLLGITEENSTYGVDFIREEGTILAYITMEKDLEVTVDGERLKFVRGSRIIVGRSKRYTEEDIARNAREMGFYIDFLTTNRMKTVAVVGYAPRFYV